MLEVFLSILAGYLIIGCIWLELALRSSARIQFKNFPHPVALSVVLVVLWPEVIRRMIAGK